jgi:predicted DNA-binding protein (MmcQ/YjbR family)
MKKPTRRPAAANKSSKRAGAGDFREAARALGAFALALPEATEDFPWGERVAKVGGKVFVFLGKPRKGGPMGLSVKLPTSSAEALDLPFAQPTGYGLGKSGWVSANFEPGDTPPVGILQSWILESYRAIAPKKLVARLDAKSGAAAATPPRRPARASSRRR